MEIMIKEIHELLEKLHQQENITAYWETGRIGEICIKIYENGTKAYENWVNPIDEKDIAELKQDLVKMVREAKNQKEMR